MSTTLPPTVTLTRTVDAAEFWSAIWGANPETSGDHWRDLEFLSGGSWEHPTEVYVELADPDDEFLTLQSIITLNDLVTAYNGLQSHDGPGGVDRSYLDLEDMDRIGADAIIQFAVYGEVIFG